MVLVCRRECGVHGTAVALSAWWRMQARRPLPSTATAAARAWSFIKKLVTRESLAKSQAGTGETSTLYYRKARECEGKDLSRIKLYEYS